MRRALLVAAVNLVVLFSLLSLLELSGQIIALLRPSYEVLYLQPDRALGWKQVPNLHWKWAGLHWYAADFSVEVKTNALGFRDLDREPGQSKGVTRVALIGDSLIEAVQVPFEKTGGQLLEKKLNVGEQHQRWEVLNFGISNYGIGQYLLVWENHASRYQPDYVFVFVARFHFERTAFPFEMGAFKATSMKQLRIRPTFRLDHDELLREEAPDYYEFVRVQDQLANSEFRGQRSRRRLQFIFPYYVDLLRSSVGPWLGAGTPDLPRVAPLDEYLLRLNLKILETLGRDVARNNSRMVIVDSALGDEHLSIQLREFCNLNGFGYIPLYQVLLEANANGKPTRWKYDGHLNELGNELLARTVYDWLATESQIRTGSARIKQ